MIKAFNNISLRFKLIFCFLLIISINSIFGFMTVNIMRELGDLVNKTYDKALMSATFAQSSKYDFSQYDSEIKSALLSRSTDEFKKHQSKSNRYFNTLIEDLSVVKERALGNKSASLVEDIIISLNDIDKIKNETMSEKILLLTNSKSSDSLPLEIKWEENKQKNILFKKLTSLYDDAAEEGYHLRLSSEESNKKNLKQTIYLLIFCSLTGLILSIGITYIIVSPLFKLGNVCKKVGEGDYASRVSIVSKDELGMLAKSFNFMLDTIEEKNENISSLLSSLPFGLFYFDSKGIISKERSRSTDLIFKKFSKYLTLTDFYDDHGFVNSRIQDIVNATFNGLLPFDSAIFLFPDLIHSGPSDKEQTIQLSFKPKYGAKGKLEKVILIAEDVTEKNKALNAGRVLTERVERVSVISSDIAGFKEFLPATNNLFSTIINLLENYETEIDSTLRRHLHSLKGLLGIFSFNTCATSIHDLETFLEVETEKKLSVALEDLKNISAIFQEQTQDIFNLLALNSDSGMKYYNIKKINLIKEIARNKKDSDYLLVLKDLDKFPIEKVLAKYSGHTKAIAEKLEDKKVTLVFDPSDEVSFEEVQRLDAALVHVLNNSIDHGIETVDKRIINHKHEVGEIRISCKRNSDQSLEFKISDDGQGINGEYLLQKALELDLINESKALHMSEEEKINLIFISGLSTKSELSETSGRGVGMDAVKSYIESLGGTIELLTKLGIGTTFSLKIPALETA